MMKERGRPEEAFLADLALVGAVRQIRMRLPRSRAFDARKEMGRFMCATGVAAGDWLLATGIEQASRLLTVR